MLTKLITKHPILQPIIYCLGTLVYAFAIALLWRWFLVPIGLRPITTLNAFGLLVLAHLVKHALRVPRQPDVVGFFFYYPLTAAVLGGLVKLCSEVL